jgi:hypothetical protein
MVEAGKQFRRVNSHMHLRSLRDTLEKVTEGLPMHACVDSQRSQSSSMSNEQGQTGARALSAILQDRGSAQAPHSLRQRQSTPR